VSEKWFAGQTNHFRWWICWSDAHPYHGAFLRNIDLAGMCEWISGWWCMRRLHDVGPVVHCRTWNVELSAIDHRKGFNWAIVKWLLIVIRGAAGQAGQRITLLCQFIESVWAGNSFIPYRKRLFVSFSIQIGINLLHLNSIGVFNKKKKKSFTAKHSDTLNGLFNLRLMKMSSIAMCVWLVFHARQSRYSQIDI